MIERDPHEHPLFWEPEEGEFERFNEWSEPKVFAFGDMDVVVEKELPRIADNYFACADLLIERVLKNDIEDFIAQFPVIYLTRHAVEIMLKQIISKQTGYPAAAEHRLTVLLEQVVGLDDWVVTRIEELSELDPRSTRLRYGGVGEKARAFIGSELHFFRRAMQELHNYLDAFAKDAERGMD